jgi:hypothetical protein
MTLHEPFEPEPETETYPTAWRCHVEGRDLRVQEVAPDQFSVSLDAHQLRPDGSWGRPSVGEALEDLAPFQTLGTALDRIAMSDPFPEFADRVVESRQLST